MTKKIMYFAALAFSLLLAACGGGGSDSEEPTLVTTTCTPAPELPSAYSRVFKGCNAAGVPQYYELTECVRDNATGLIWQGQMPAGSGHLRANNQYKTNFDSTTAKQNWNGSEFVAPTQAQIDASTNSLGFKNAVNASNLCGSTAWRLPTKDELIGIVNTSEAPKINNAWFPNTPAFGKYWSATPSFFTTGAFGVDFNVGEDYLDGRAYGSGYLVRLVR